MDKKSEKEGRFENIFPLWAREYSEYINAEQLVLANKSTPLGEEHIPSDLTELQCPVAEGRVFQLRRDAAMALCAMMREMSEEGVTDAFVTSAYRSYEYQKGLYSRYVDNHMQKEGLTREEAEAKASTYSARPGESEHQTGLCVDLTTKSLGGRLNDDFDKTPAFAWLEKNAAKYGFILRYPKDKTHITGYDYEPWHYRFVGNKAALRMTQDGLCLEEYLEDIF